MKFETLNSGKFRFWKRFCIGVSLFVFVLVGALMFYHSYAKYRVTSSIKIVSSNVSYDLADLNVVALYQQQLEGEEPKKCSSDSDTSCYERKTEVPSTGVSLNETRSHCDVDGKKEEGIEIKYEDGSLSFNNITKTGTKCYVYLDAKTKGDFLAKFEEESHGVTSKFNGAACQGSCTITDENGIYQSEDDFGTSYYFRGTVQNNWVKFGKDKNQNDIYWRIIRVNGDGTIRLIYAGTGTGDTAPNPTGTQTQINSTTYPFNSSYNDNMYVGYQYASGDKRGHTSPSNAYTQLKQWFSENLDDEWNSGNGKIDPNAGFCGDRSSSTSSSASWLKEGFSESGGTGSSGSTYYGAYLRLTQSNRQPTLKCSTKGNEDKDYFTYTNAKETDASDGSKIKGTQSLEYPVGLITADEVAFAGGYYGSNNTNYWLYTNSNYWTMSPSNFTSSSSYAYVFYVRSDGTLLNTSVINTCGLRPVINLKADTTFTFPSGDSADTGTSKNPYVVKSS